METPEKIPLDEAVARELIPCSVCGAKGAGVRQVGGKKHLLCAACEARGRRWTWGAIVALVVVAGVVAVSRFRAKPVDPPSPPAPPLAMVEAERIEKEIVDLIQQKRYRDAAAWLRQLLQQNPGQPLLNLYMGQCLINLGYFELSARHFQAAMAGDPKDEAECRASLGMALQSLGHSAQALPFLEKEFKGSSFEKSRQVLLAECYLDLERYEDAIKVLQDKPPDLVNLRVRHRALLYLGKPDEARKVFEAADVPPVSRAMSLALQFREEGDFAGALKILEEAAAKVDPKSLDLLHLRQAILQVHVESGDLARLEDEASELAKCLHPITAGEARYYLVLGRLMAGKRDVAVAAANEFLGTMDILLGLLRAESLMMQHLAGTRKVEDLVGEAAKVSRFRANDLYFYIALATGDPAWAKKAAESTPGHNFPYHAIQRLLKK